MASIAVLERKCDLCQACVRACPFGALELKDGRIDINAGCRVCGVCVRACPQQAIIKLETRAQSVDKTKWAGILVFAEVSGGRLHPVSLELLGKARALAQGTDNQVCAVIAGNDVMANARALTYYGVDKVYVYDDPALDFFRAEAFADCVEDTIKHMKPASVLVGATALGRSLAPRLAARFHTGLTADCTALELRANSDLVQIRPAFGGNIMAKIVTTHTRPQFATVRYKVMDAPARMSEPSGEILARALPNIKSRVRFVNRTPIPKAANISDADVIIAAGRGVRKQADLDMIRELADIMGGEWATSRPLVEKGWNTNLRQIGLSGRTVKPKLLMAFGISGAIQFTACMSAAEHIIAVNSDPNAPIFKVAHVGIVGDLYDVLPDLISRLKEARGQ